MAKWSRNDGNHDDIREAFKQLGYLVKSTAMVGEGFPDLVCFRPDVGVVLVEVKTDKGKLRHKQEAFVAKGWPVRMVRTVEDVT